MTATLVWGYSPCGPKSTRKATDRTGATVPTGSRDVGPAHAEETVGWYATVANDLVADLLRDVGMGAIKVQLSHRFSR